MPRIDRLSADALWQRWRDDIEQVRQDAHEIFSSRRTFRQIAELFRNNVTLQEQGGHIWDWMRVSYASYLLIRIRRMTDVQRNTVSLGQLLSEIEARPEVVTRGRFIGMLATTEQWLVDINQKAFSELWVGDASRLNPQDPDTDFVDPGIVAADHAALMKAADRVREVANQRVAHRTRVTVQELQTAEADAALDGIEKALQKYYVLFHGSYLSQLEPVPQFDTNAVFKFPWFSKPDEPK